jgi:predicted PurR-regulated permease PerM
MDFLRSIGGIFASGIVRLLVIAGTLLLIYLLFVRPALDTANEAINKFNVPDSSNAIQRQIQRQIRQTNRQVRRQVNRSFKQTPSVRSQQKLLRCVQRANGKVKRIQACGRRF